MSLATLAPKTRLPEHSAGWTVLRVITDRAGKYQTSGPPQWMHAGHRRHTRDEYEQILTYRLHRIHAAATLTDRR